MIKNMLPIKTFLSLLQLQRDIPTRLFQEGNVNQTCVKASVTFTELGISQLEKKAVPEKWHVSIYFLFKDFFD